MTADRHPWVGRLVEGFDYAKMAAEALQARKSTNMDECLKQRSQLALLDDEYHEQMALFKLFSRRAEERRIL